ncbi:MAG: hypothetical protein KKG47_05480 [Proteobacteria bacterium]|nr:hypothetical protein [Pseudomonadota bacterium]MBU1736927.1 hypothetical protein [Pseudomonadota bacterium]
MTILYLLKGKPDPTLQKILTAQKKLHKIETIDLEQNREYGRIVAAIAAADRVVSW